MAWRYPMWLACDWPFISLGWSQSTDNLPVNSAGVDMAGRQAEFDERVKRMVELNDAAAGESGDDDNDDSVSP